MKEDGDLIFLVWEAGNLSALLLQIDALLYFTLHCLPGSSNNSLTLLILFGPLEFNSFIASGSGWRKLRFSCILKDFNYNITVSNS